MKNIIVILGLSLTAFACTTQPKYQEQAPPPQTYNQNQAPRDVAQVNNALTAKLKAIEAQYQACIDNPKNHSTNGNIQCAYTKNTAADAELNKLYKSFIGKTDINFSAESKKRLKAAQKAWITYRDTNCSLQGASNEGGSLERMIIAICTAEMTFKRTGELNDILNDSY